MAEAPGLVFVNRFYWPEETATAQLLTDLAEALAARGRRVAVVTRRVERPPARRGVRIIGAGAPARRRATGFAGKAAEFASFWLAARAALPGVTRPGDALIALTDPPLLGVGASGAARRAGASLYHWIQDIYPEVAAAVAGGPGWGLLRGMRDRAWRSAAGCVTLGADMAGLVASRGIQPARLHIVPNWAPAGLAPAPAEAIAAVRASWGGGWDEPGAFIVGYSGNLGRVHELDSVLALAAELRGESGIWFQFAGVGPQRARIEAEARARGLTRVRFAPAAPRESLAAALGAADLHLVTLRPGCERCVFPSKLYGIGAVGRPVLFLGPRDCEIARLVETSGMGRAVAIPEAIGAAAAIVRGFRDDPGLRQAAGRAAADFAGRHSGPEAAAEFWDRLTRGERMR